MARRSLNQKRVLLTGASSGIGRALALRLATAGARLVVTARRADSLTELCQEIVADGGDATSVPADLTSPESRSALVQSAIEHLGGLDILINNAGIGAIGPFAEASPLRLRTVMEVNFVAPLELIRAALPALREGRRPVIVNVSSVLGHRAVPNKSEYCASKFALHGFSDALRAELAKEAIDVLLVSPSTTASRFFENVIEGQESVQRRAATPEWVANRITTAIERGHHEIILTWGGKALVWLDRVCPRLANNLVARFG